MKRRRASLSISCGPRRRWSISLDGTAGQTEGTGWFCHQVEKLLCSHNSDCCAKAKLVAFKYSIECFLRIFRMIFCRWIPWREKRRMSATFWSQLVRVTWIHDKLLFLGKLWSEFCTFKNVIIFLAAFIPVWPLAIKTYLNASVHRYLIVSRQLHAFRANVFLTRLSYRFHCHGW